MKIMEFRHILEKKNLDAAVLYNSEFPRINPNMVYFSGYTGLGMLVIPKNKQPFLMAPEMEFQKAKKSMVKKVYSMQKKRFFESVSDIIRKNGIKAKNIAIDRNNFTLNSFKYFKKSFRKSKFRDVSLDCTKLREIKTNKEIEYLKTSCNCADKIIQKTIKNFRDFRTESEAAAFLEYETKKFGLELSFNPIVASGSNGSMPHHEPKNEKIKSGLCVIDFGVKYNGYCSDITRTICVGKPKKEEISMYNLLLKIQNGTINQIKENKKCSELYDFVNKNLGKYKKYFTHGLGHGVGIEIHEMPNLTLNSKDKIQNNMVFTIEPGVYFPKKYGIRIEDTVLFKNKPIVLTKTSKDLLII
ncbi:MAG TPA: Xaa-Pro peptidase family protein [Candidatus Nanoarchaeia archaeon]|nr:Xaa-Pro peptidase family protein [Candidatus Nanoarchaeia archaeon]